MEIGIRLYSTHGCKILIRNAKHSFCVHGLPHKHGLFHYNFGPATLLWKHKIFTFGKSCELG